MLYQVRGAHYEGDGGGALHEVIGTLYQGHGRGGGANYRG